MTRAVANWILGERRDLSGRKRLWLSFGSRDEAPPAPARNVVALVEGSDPRLKSEYVVLSAHLDHLALADTADRVGADSVYNGADDGGTGSVALLEIARHLASLPVRPKRSVLLLWTVGEEEGPLGAEYFADRPTVPRERIVATLTLDMLGRGGAVDVAGGGPAYLEVHGARRLSEEYGDWIAAVNERGNEGGGFGFRLEEQTDGRRGNAQAYCDGDDWHFARWGIPSARLSTGRHADYHRVTDEVDRIDFDKYARVTRFAAALVVDIANRPARPRPDEATPNPRTACIP